MARWEALDSEEGSREDEGDGDVAAGEGSDAPEVGKVMLGGTA